MLQNGVALRRKVAHLNIRACVKLKDRKCSLSGKKNDHNALWHYRNSYNAKFRVVAVFKQPQRVVAREDMP